jgi:HAD superfamily hydrolase (TIGR01549 family)
MERIHIAEAYFHHYTRLHRHIWSSEQAIESFWISYYTNLLHPFFAQHDKDGLLRLSYAVNNEFKKHTSWQLYPDVLPTLKALRARGYTLGVISDWGIALGPILRKHGLATYFDCLLISAATQHAKPSPHLYERALQRVNAIPDYSLHIGDSYIHDVLGARAVGMTPVLLDRKASLEERRIDCPLVYSLYELLDLLEVARP